MHYMDTDTFFSADHVVESALCCLSEPIAIVMSNLLAVLSNQEGHGTFYLSVMLVAVCSVLRVRCYGILIWHNILLTTQSNTSCSRLQTRA